MHLKFDQMPRGVMAMSNDFPFLFPLSRVEQILCREESVV